MTVLGVVRARPRIRVFAESAYLVVAVGLAAAAGFGLGDGIAWAILAVATMFVLGPISLGVALAVGPLLLLLLGAPFEERADGVPLALIVIGLAVVVALINIHAVRRWTRPSSLAVDRAWDRPLGSVLFVLAGCAFIVLCYVAGFAAYRGGAIWGAYELPGWHRGGTAAAVGIVSGFVLAVTGLVVWIVRVRRQRPIALLGGLDLATMALVNIAVLVVARSGA